MKRTSAKVLMSILIILTMIPFSIVEASSEATVTMTYGNLDGGPIVNNSGSGYLYYTTNRFAVFNFSEKSTGSITITTSSYSSNTSGWLKWNTSNLFIYNANVTKLSDYQFRLDFTNVDFIYIQTTTNNSVNATANFYEEVKSWTVNAVIADDPLQTIIQNQEDQQATFEEILSKISYLSDQLGIFSNKHQWTFPCSQGVNAGYNLITVPTENVGQNIWIKLSDNNTYFSKNYIYHFFLPYQYRNTDNIYYPDLSDGLWTFNETSKSTRVHYKEGLANTFKYKIYNDINGFHLYVWDLYTVQNVNEVLLAHFNFMSSIRYLAVGGYWEEMPLNTYLGGMFYTNLEMLYNTELLLTGNSTTNNTTNENDSITEQTNETINDYISLESTFTSDFTDSQEQLTTVLQNTSLTQFSNALIWFTSQLTGIYNSLGDMKILVQLPLILGIALFIIGRGAVIFREPVTERETTTINETWKNGKYVGSTKTHSYSATQGRRRARK